MRVSEHHNSHTLLCFLPFTTTDPHIPFNQRLTPEVSYGQAHQCYDSCHLDTTKDTNTNPRNDACAKNQQFSDNDQLSSNQEANFSLNGVADQEAAASAAAAANFVNDSLSDSAIFSTEDDSAVALGKVILLSSSSASSSSSRTNLPDDTQVVSLLNDTASDDQVSDSVALTAGEAAGDLREKDRPPRAEALQMPLQATPCPPVLLDVKSRSIDDDDLEDELELNSPTTETTVTRLKTGSNGSGGGGGVGGSENGGNS